MSGLLVASVTALVVLVARLRPADVAVDKNAVVIARVERGSMTLAVRGTGKLVPQRVQFVTAVTAGRVEQVLVEPGTEVQAHAVLVRLSNPEVDLQRLQAQQQLVAAQAQLADVRRALETARLVAEAQLATTRSDHEAVEREAQADKELAERQLVSREQAQRSAERAAALARRFEAESKGIEVLRDSARIQYASLTEQIQRLREISDYHQQRLASLEVRAGAAGVVQDLDLQPGQWVQPGTTLTRVVGPGGLKAELRISQVQARDVQVGQRALVDTRVEIIEGRVKRVDPNVREGFVPVEIELTGDLPPSARPELSIDGTIIIEELEDVLHVERPAMAASGAVLGLFKLDPEASTAVRAPVRLGRASIQDIEVRDGLSEGDRVIVSDMSAWDYTDRVRLR